MTLIDIGLLFSLLAILAVALSRGLYDDLD